MQLHITIVIVCITLVMVTIVTGMMTLTVMYVVSMLHAYITVMHNIGM